MKLVLVTVEKIPPDENKLNAYILIKKYNKTSKKLISNMLSK